MNLSRRIAVNTTVLFLAKLLISLLSLFVSTVLARYLGASVYGDYSFVFAYLTLFQALTGTAIDTIVVKEISRDPSQQDVLVGNAVSLKFLFSIAAALIAVAVATFLGYSRDIRVLIGIASITLLFAFGSVYTAVFQSRLQATYYAIPELVINAAFSLLMFLFVALKASLVTFVFLQSVLAVPVTITYALFSRRILRVETGLRFDFGIWRTLLRQSGPIFISSMFISVNMRIDQVMLFRMVGSEGVGLYSASVRLAESLAIIPVVFMTSLYPILCETFARSREGFEKLCRRSFKYVSIVIVPIALGTTLLSGRIIRFFFGDSFLPASSSLAILIWAEVYVFLGVVFANAMTAAGIQRYMSLFTIFGAATNVGLNLVLIPRFGIAGASLATLLSYGGFGYALQGVFRETRSLTVASLASLIGPVLCALPMGVFVYVAQDMNLFFLIPAAALIYGIVILVSKTLDEEDVEYLRSIFRPADTE